MHGLLSGQDDITLCPMSPQAKPIDQLRLEARAGEWLVRVAPGGREGERGQVCASSHVARSASDGKLLRTSIHFVENTQKYATPSGGRAASRRTRATSTVTAWPLRPDELYISLLGFSSNGNLSEHPHLTISSSHRLIASSPPRIKASLIYSPFPPFLLSRLGAA